MRDLATILERLQAWYFWQCDGDWEHGAGVKIATIDNPGWSVTIDIDDTDLEEVPYSPTRTERSQEDWLQCWREGPGERVPSQFKVYCGARNLEEALAGFLDWADANTPAPPVAKFTEGQIVRVDAAPPLYVLHNGKVASIRETRRVGSVASASEHFCRMGDLVYLIEYTDGSTIEIAERYLNSRDT